MTDEPPFWTPCPNDPPCPHFNMQHDIWTVDDPRPTCCVEGCDCGRAQAAEVARRARL